MIKGFKDGVVLTQKSAGVGVMFPVVDVRRANRRCQHCSLSAASLCTAKYVRDYFRDGKLPPAGAVCEVEDELFSAARSQAGNSIINEADVTLLAAMRQLSDDFEVSPMH
jgi:hypothetical protein